MAQMDPKAVSLDTDRANARMQKQRPDLKDLYMLIMSNPFYPANLLLFTTLKAELSHAIHWKLSSEGLTHTKKEKLVRDLLFPRLRKENR